MSCDALAESVRLLEGAPLPGVARLSRRVRSLPLAVYRDSEVAATMFLRRGVSGVPLLEVHSLERTGARGGCSAAAAAPGTRCWTPRSRVAELGSPAVGYGGGGTSRTRGSRLRWRGGGWVSWAELRLAEEVAVLRVDSRLLPVAGHGCAVVVWTRRPPRVAALDRAGAVLGPVSELLSPLARPRAPAPRPTRAVFRQ